MKSSCKDKHIRYLRYTCAVTTLLALSATPWLAEAQAVNTTQDMSFGFVRMTNNAAAHQIKFNPGGGWSADPEYIFYSNPIIATVSATGFTPDTKLKISFVPATWTLPPGNGMGPGFDISNFFTIPPNIKTSGIGNVTFDVGAEILSDGSGTGYQDTNFTFPFTINVEEDP